METFTLKEMELIKESIRDNKGMQEVLLEQGKSDVIEREVRINKLQDLEQIENKLKGLKHE